MKLALLSLILTVFSVSAHAEVEFGLDFTGSALGLLADGKHLAEEYKSDLQILLTGSNYAQTLTSAEKMVRIQSGGCGGEDNANGINRVWCSFRIYEKDLRIVDEEAESVYEISAELLQKPKSVEVKKASVKLIAG